MVTQLMLKLGDHRSWMKCSFLHSGFQGAAALLLLQWRWLRYRAGLDHSGEYLQTSLGVGFPIRNDKLTAEETTQAALHGRLSSMILVFKSI